VTQSTENLYRLDDGPVRSAVLKSFTDALRALPSVRETFFHDVMASFPYEAREYWSKVATAMVCSAIARSSLFGFANTIHQAAADAYWQDRLNGSSEAVSLGHSIYRELFPGLCSADGLTFERYLPERSHWGNRLAEAVTRPAFINTTIARLIAGDADWPQKLNLVFYKLYRLEPVTVDRVVGTWQAAFPDKAISVQWPGYNYIEAFHFTPQQYLAPVNKAISVRHRRSLGRATQYTYGREVDAFIGDKARALGLATGTTATNSLICPPDCPSD
jgi:hypothetical protein